MIKLKFENSFFSFIYSKLSKKLDFGDTFVLKHASNGALYFAVSDAINGVTGQGSKLLNYDFS